MAYLSIVLLLVFVILTVTKVLCIGYLMSYLYTILGLFLGSLVLFIIGSIIGWCIIRKDYKPTIKAIKDSYERAETREYTNFIEKVTLDSEKVQRHDDSFISV